MTHNPYRLDWVPDLSARSGDVYQAIADALAEDIKTGRLKPGTRLPPQRLLAYTLDLNPGTVNKAYRLAMQRGLISGEVGRGSFVRGSASGLSWPNEDPYARAIDFCDNFPCAIKNADLFKKQLTALATTPYFAELLQYQQNSAWPGHQAVAAGWVSRCGVVAEPRHILITSGALHAGFISLMTLCRAGDTILAEEFTSQAVKGAAQRLKLRLHGIKMDRQGIQPDHLESLLKAHKVAAVYLVPTLHNPTATLLSTARRKAVAKLLERHGVPLIEDDVFAPLLDEPSPPISSFLPHGGFYIAGLSKALAPTLRLAFLSVPERHYADAMSNLRITSWLASPLLMELAANLIARGDADKLIKDQRAEIRRRQALAKDLLGGFDLSAHPNAPHCWLRLPAPWRAAQFKDALAKREVLAEATDSFVVDRANPSHAIRICLGTPPTFERVKEGLHIIRDTLVDA
ncbi:MAG: PLP-dependent aminotransferase family protein [Rhizomicrobium sp.]|nr:PLP-dependent aminotransferase family protein [Rhizomicrobium sp.]